MRIRKREGHAKPWPKHQVLDSVGNESPQFTNIVGDERPELVCTHDGFFGYATIDPEPAVRGLAVPPDLREGRARSRSATAWASATSMATAGMDVLMKDGWFEQPAGAGRRSAWAFHRAKFATTGGAEMYAYDVDGDGDNDVITSLAAHDFGLAWHEQIRDGDKIAFRQHVDHGRRAGAQSLRRGVQRAALGQSGRHRRRRPEGHRHRQDLLVAPHQEPAVGRRGGGVLVPTGADAKDGVDWVPYQGRWRIGHRPAGDRARHQQGWPAGHRRRRHEGRHVLLHRREAVSEAQWKGVQPKVLFPDAEKAAVRLGQPVAAAVAATKAPRISGVLEGEDLKVAQTTAGKTQKQNIERLQGRQMERR